MVCAPGMTSLRCKADREGETMNPQCSRSSLAQLAAMALCVILGGTPSASAQYIANPSASDKDSAAVFGLRLRFLY